MNLVFKRKNLKILQTQKFRFSTRTEGSQINSSVKNKQF